MPAPRLPRELRRRINQVAYRHAKLHKDQTSYRQAYRLEKAKLTIWAANLLASGISEPIVAERLRDRRMELAKTLRKLEAAVREME